MSTDEDLRELDVTPPGDGSSSLLGEPVSLRWPLLKDDSCFKNNHRTFKTLIRGEVKVFCAAGLTGALLRRVLMPCLLFTSSSSFTALNLNEVVDFGAGGRHPCLFSYVRQLVHSRGFALLPWCRSLEPVRENVSQTHFPSDPEQVRTHLLHHSGCSSWRRVHCLHCQHHPHWQNSHQLQNKRAAPMRSDHSTKRTPDRRSSPE